MFTISIHSRAEKVTLVPALSPGNVALLVSFAAHVGVVIAAVAHAHSHPRVDLHADLQALREVPVEVRADDVDVLDQAAAAAEPSSAALSATPRASEPQPHATPTAVNVAPREARGEARAAAIAPSPVEAADDGAAPAAVAPPRFVMLAPVVSGVSGVNASVGSGSSGVTSVASAAAPELPIAEQFVDAPAKLLRGAPPSYTAAAESAGIEAEVPLEVVIDASGSVQTARPLTHVGYGLDEAAISAVRHYRFAPARRANKLVAVRMRWVMRFQLR